MAQNYHYGLLRKDEMNFVYAAFFADREDVYIKFGRSGTPYKRVQQIAETCPFVLSQAAFAASGTSAIAVRIERSISHLLAGYRIRGEWYRFAAGEGRIFSATINTVFAKMTGKKLAWSVIDHAAILADMEAYSRKWVRPRRPCKIAQVA